ncbi:MAG: HAD hydrolase-like protein [Clostridiaceae bacterium]|nr:HAD hydrolase-like protein [Clostridiaceae bacterium]
MVFFNRRTGRAAIFDLDGTLLDTLPSIMTSCNEILDCLKLPPFDRDVIRTFLGLGSRILIERLMAAAGVTGRSTIDEDHRRYRELAPRQRDHRAAPFEGISEMLGQVADMGLKLGVMTNKSDKLAPGVIADSFPSGLFEAVRGARRFVPLKPDPRSTFHMLRSLGADPPASFFIGDSDVDVLTGRAAGMHTIAVTWGYRPTEELEALSPDCLARSPDEIVDYIRRQR